MWIDLSRPGDSEETIVYKQRLWQSMMPAPFFMLLSGTIVWWLSLPRLAVAMWIFGGYITVLATVLLVKKRYERIIAGIMLYLGVIFSTVVTLLFGGILSSGGVVLVGLASCIFSMSFLSRRQTNILFGFYFLFVLIAPFIESLFTPIEVIPPRINLVLFALHILVIAVNIYAIISQYLEESVRMKAREAEQWKALDAMKNEFYTNISHEFRTPLTVILGMAEQLRLKPQQMLGKGVQTIRKNGQRLLDLVNQMLDLSGLESGYLQLHPMQDDVIRFFHYLLEPYIHLAEEKDIHMMIEMPKGTLLMDFDADRLQSVVGNLISNAIRHTPSGSDIHIRVWSGKEKLELASSSFQLFPNRHLEEEKEYLMFSVADQGQGILPDELPLIFDRFYQGKNQHASSSGTGIGLALVRDLLDLMQGQLQVCSSSGEGSEFTVILPVTRMAEQRKISSVEQWKASEESTIEEIPLENNGRRLLIIEDSKDIAQYISAILQDNYQINFAGNGKEGIEKARTAPPDLIISDIMMPEMDGYEVCQVLKNNLQTSHIPIILLTARADRDSRIRGLESGADAYLVKPFDSEELQIRLQKLWQLRSSLQEKYRMMAFTQTDQQLPENQDTLFMKEVKRLMQEHLDDESFDIQHLANMLHISRSHLYRKIKALTGNSASELFRSLRLHRARELLLHTDYNISEIGYEVGFKDPAYFSRAFTREFGMNPSMVRNLISEGQE